MRVRRRAGDPNCGSSASPSKRAIKSWANSEGNERAVWKRKPGKTRGTEENSNEEKRMGTMAGSVYRNRFRLLLLFTIVAFVINIHFIYYRIESNQKLKTRSNHSYGSSQQDLESLEFVTPFARNPALPCNVTLESAKKSLRRAKTRECRQLIKDAACKLQNGQLYPMRLNRDACPLAGNNKGHFIGCFADSSTNRLLSAHKYDFYESNTPEECVDSCLRIGYQAAGVQYSHQCFCGDLDSLESGTKLEDKACRQFECPGDPNQRCGGFQSLAVYHTGHGGAHTKVGVYVPFGVPSSSTKPHRTRIAFLLQFNGRAVRQVKRLIKLIYRPWHYYLVHVDVRQEYMYREMKELEADLNQLGIRNFVVKEKRYATIWGGASLLEMILDALKEMLEKWSDWDVAMNLSEADFLVLSLEEIERFLGSYPGHSFLRSHGKGTQKFIGAQGLDRAFVQCENRMWRVGDRELPKGIRLDGGSDWIGLSRRFATYSVHSNDEITVGLKRLFRYTLLPAESFFHTLAANSEFCNATVNSNLKLTNWKRKIGCKCQYKHIVDWCGCSPSVFLSEDQKRLTRNQAENRLYFTARKFEAIIDQGIIDFVENQSLGPEAASKNRALTHPSYGKYWQNEFHHKDSITHQFDAVVKNTAANQKRASTGNTVAQELFLALVGLEARLRLVGGPSFQSRLKLGTDINPLELTLYKEAPNSHIEMLVKFEIDCGETTKSIVAIETRVMRKSAWRTSANHQDIIENWKLVGMEVGTKFDPKEEIFRNYAGVIAPDSAPSLRHRWEFKDPPVGVVKNITNLVTTWINPQGHVRYRSPPEIISPGQLIRHTDMEPDELDRTEMEAGVWRVQLSIRAIVFAEIAFPVFPSSSAATSSLRDSKFLEPFYDIKDSCLSKSHESGPDISKNSECISQLNQVLPYCSDTEWSSEFPDLKSDISNGYDETLKLLV